MNGIWTSIKGFFTASSHRDRNSAEIEEVRQEATLARSKATEAIERIAKLEGKEETYTSIIQALAMKKN